MTLYDDLAEMIVAGVAEMAMCRNCQGTVILHNHMWVHLRDLALHCSYVKAGVWGNIASPSLYVINEMEIV